ncbi:unnamed protein product [Blumeria hordei]|uniref:Uncharacterized protein n=1 Tax=Blumeria hordei TaxID=2867405 RepID=A0A383USQ0_BLUHO|nr:unnamed protein product [Blumeria hordei]
MRFDDVSSSLHSYMIKYSTNGRELVICQQENRVCQTIWHGMRQVIDRSKIYGVTESSIKWKSSYGAF